MLQEHGVDFNDIAEKLKDKTNAHLMYTCNVAIVVILQTVNSDRVFCLANCHLWWEPSAVLIREYQLQYLLMKIKEAKEQLSLKSSETPTFICGDLNEELNKFSKLNEIFTKIGYLSSYSTFFSQREQENEKDENKKLNKESKEKYCTIYTPQVKGVVDAIVYSGKHVTNTCVLSLPPETELIAECGISLPSDSLPSDHLFILSKFDFK